MNKDRIHFKGARVVVAVMLSCVATASAREFTELKTTHFTIFSDWNESETRRFANQIAALESVIATITNVKDFKPAVPMRIYALSSTDWRKYILIAKGLGSTGNAAGYFRGGTLQNDIAFNSEVSDRKVGLELVLHEYTHFVVHNAGVGYPVWFNEGLADVFASLELKRGKVIIGRRPILRTPGETWLPLAKMFQIKYGTKEFAENTGALYYQSWGLAHYAVLGDPKPMMEFLRRLQSGADIEAASMESFKMSTEQLGTTLRRYVSAPTIKAVAIERDSLPQSNLATLSVRTLSQSDSDIEFAGLLVRWGKFDEAKEIYARAIKRDPKDYRALAGSAMANLARKNGDPEADKEIAAALALAPRDPIVLRNAGAIAMRNINARAQALEYFRQALALNPEDFESLVGYSLAANVIESERMVALNKLTTAFRESPRNPVIAMLYATLSSTVGKSEQARAGWQIVARYAHDSNQRRRALDILQRGVATATSDDEEESKP